MQRFYLVLLLVFSFFSMTAQMPLMLHTPDKTDQENAATLNGSFLNQNELNEFSEKSKARELIHNRRSELSPRERIELRRQQLTGGQEKSLQNANTLQQGRSSETDVQRPNLNFSDSDLKTESNSENETPESLRQIPSPLKAASNIEEIFSGRFPDSVSRKLQQFGYDLFNRQPSSFTPLEDVPVNYDYIVGPGDTFTINVWGSANFSHSVTVNREGNIFIPKVGNIRVWGETWKQMSQKIRARLGNFFSGIKMDIALDGIRMIDVYVIGEVDQPGAYSVPSTATPINALFYSGGAKKKGSLRKIKLLRNNKEIATIDLYDFLIGGKSIKQNLQSQDVILVPIIGAVAAVGGHVKRPAIYEITPKTSVFDLLELAGGLSFAGAVGRLSLERVSKNKERIVKDIEIPENYSELTPELAHQTELGMTVTDGDIIQIFPVYDRFKSTVFLMGHVKRPGSYEFKEGMKIKDLIPNFDVLLPEPYTTFVQIVRKVPPKDEKKALFANLESAINGDEAANLSLQEGDEVYIFSKDELNLRDKVSISGRVNQPGDYVFFDGMRLRDLILMAGNLTQDAYSGQAEIARYVVEKEKLNFKRLSVSLAAALAGNDKNNPLLLPKDKIFVRALPGWELSNQIKITGQVKFPGSYSFFKNERLSGVIKRAGGFTDQAFLPGTVFNRESVKQMQKKNLDEQIRRLEDALIQESINPAEYSNAEQHESAKEGVSVQQALVRNLRAAQVTGRMVIGMAPLEDFEGAKHDIRLEPGDELFVPSIPSVVTVMGEVYSPTSIVFDSGKTVSHYLEMAGGPTSSADVSSIFVIKADGSVISRRQDRGFLLRNFYQTKIERGDSILVPKDISAFSFLQATKDITDIVFKIASTTGITIQAFK